MASSRDAVDAMSLRAGVCLHLAPHHLDGELAGRRRGLGGSTYILILPATHGTRVRRRQGLARQMRVEGRTREQSHGHRRHALPLV